MKEDSRRLFCQIKCHSHILSPEAFEDAPLDNTPIRFLNIKEDSFVIELKNPIGDMHSDAEFCGRGTNIFNAWVISFNIATPGHFDWYDKLQPTHTIELLNLKKNSIAKLTTKHDYQYPAAKAALTKEMVARACSIFLAVAVELEQSIMKEYLKGIYHFGYSFFSLTFEKEAFANFYRVFERFMTARVLKKKRLSNEKKMFKEGFEKLGIEGMVVDAFCNDLYRLRSAQVMHAQREQTDITWEDSATMKILTDLVMYKFYKPISDDVYAKLRDASKSSGESSNSPSL